MNGIVGVGLSDSGRVVLSGGVQWNRGSVLWVVARRGGGFRGEES